MDQVPNLLPSYWTRRRQIQADVAAFFHDSSDHVDLSDSTVHSHSLDHSNDDISDCNTESGMNESNYNDADIFLSDTDDDAADDDDECAVDNDFGSESSLNDLLAGWAVQCDINQVGLRALLRILHGFHPHLPLDGRTLRKTYAKWW